MSLEGQARLSAKLQAIASALSSLLDQEAGEHVLFTVLIWGETNDHRAQYVSNCKREDVADAIKELLQRWGKDYKDDGPYHVYHKGN